MGFVQHTAIDPLNAVFDEGSLCSCVTDSAIAIKFLQRSKKLQNLNCNNL
jgi:hypothetical protein